MSRQDRKKITSQRKVAANRANGRKSHGPKDTSRTRHNARKTGLFSSILTVSEAEHEAFERLRAGVLADLQPEGELLCALVDRIVEQHWRLRQTLGLEQHALREQQHQNALEGTTPPSARPGSRELSEAGRLLDTVADHAEHRAATPSELIDLSRQALGAAFTPALFDFKPPNLTAVWMAEEMCAKNRTWFQKETQGEMIE